jgi:peroxiredoxin
VSLYVLPADLPEPVDDGACDHLAGKLVPELVLDSSQGAVELAGLATGLGVLYIYPRTGKPGVPVPDGWDAIPGARGCTPQSCGFRDHEADLAALGARVAGLSVQPLDEQIEVAERLGLTYPVIADPERKLGAVLGLPTLEFAQAVLYRRVTLVLDAGRIVKVFYPVFPPDQNARDVVDWLRERG